MSNDFQRIESSPTENQVLNTLNSLCSFLESVGKSIISYDLLRVFIAISDESDNNPRKVRNPVS